MATNTPLPSVSNYKSQFTVPRNPTDALDLIPVVGTNIKDTVTDLQNQFGPGRAILVLTDVAIQNIGKIFADGYELKQNILDRNINVDNPLTERTETKDYLSALGTVVNSPFGFVIEDSTGYKLQISDYNNVIDKKISPNKYYKERKQLNGILNFDTADIFVTKQHTITINNVLGLKSNIKEYINSNDLGITIKFKIVNQNANSLPYEQIEDVNWIFEVASQQSIKIFCPYLNKFGVQNIIIYDMNINQLRYTNMVECTLKAYSETII